MAQSRFASLLTLMLFTWVPATSGIVLAPQPAHGQSRALPDLYKRVRALESAGRYAEATPLAEQLVRRNEAELGENHPDTAVALNHLANLYETLGRYADAEPLYKRSLAINEKALGAAHPNVARSLNNLGRLGPGPFRRGRAALQARTGDAREGAARWPS